MANWTPEQNIYLSCLLDDVTGTDKMVKIRRDYCKIYDCMRSINTASDNVYYTGSKAEGLDLRGSDDDFMLDMNNFYDIEVSESAQNLLVSSRRNKLLIVTDNVPPAFAMLKCLALQNPDLRPSAVTIGNDMYFSSKHYLSSWIHLCTTPGLAACRIQGPSLEIWNAYEDTSQSGRDNVDSILCKFWPTSAAEWKVRPRHYGWPSQHDKEYIEQFGCHLVPVGHPLSAMKSLEWRLSFSIAEKMLVWSFNHTQLQCYAVMKLILKEFIKKKCCEKHKNVLCSYFIKTFLFWQFETTEQSFWQKTNLTGCIMYLLCEFYICIQTGVLRHYFVSCFNLLEVKLTPDAKTEILRIFHQVIEHGIPIIGQCSSLSGVFSHFFEIRSIGHCAERTSEITHRRILENDGITMDFVHTDISEIAYNIHVMLPCGSLLAAIVRLNSETSSTSLAMFAIRRVCLSIAIRKLYNSSDQCNKYLHFFMRSLRKNIYGTDLASSTLWLATYLLEQGDYNKSLQNIKDVMYSIPPYALYVSGEGTTSGDISKQLYVDRYCEQTDILYRAKEAWLFDIHIYHRDYSFMPRAIQIELDYCDPTIGVCISPFTYAYYMVFLCYHELGQYENRDRALRQLVDTVNDKDRCGVHRHHSFNIAGHCMLMAGYVTRDFFLKSVQFTHTLQSPVFDKHNAAYKYLSLM